VSYDHHPYSRKEEISAAKAGRRSNVLLVVECVKAAKEQGLETVTTNEVAEATGLAQQPTRAALALATAAGFLRRVQLGRYAAKKK